jgi:hypothetical protein
LIARLELCTRPLLADSSIDGRGQPQIAVKPFAVMDFRRVSGYPTLAIGCVKALYDKRQRDRKPHSSLEWGTLLHILVAPFCFFQHGSTLIDRRRRKEFGNFC